MGRLVGPSAPEPAERIEVMWPQELPGTTVTLADDCARRWQVAHTTYTVCTALAGGRPAPWRYRGRTYEQTADGLQFMEPGEVHANTVQTDPASFRVLMIEPEVLDRAARELGSRTTPHLRLAQTTSRDHPELRQAFLRFHASLEEPATTLERQTNLAECLRVVLEQVGEGLPSRNAREMQAPPFCREVERARDFIMAHLNESISLDVLAAAAGASSRYQLIRAFRQSFGVPPHAYQLSRRIGQSRVLLSDGVPPAEVAAELGFADQSHFTRHFSRALGVTPAAYAQGAAPRSPASPERMNSSGELSPAITF